MLTFVNNAIDRQTGTIMLRGTFPNDDARLWPGQFVEANLTLRVIQNAVVAPEAAVQTAQTGEYVFVVQPDNTVRLQPVETGESVDGLVRILSGLQPGDRVVTDGQLRLAPGVMVEEKRGLTAASPATGSGT